MALDPTPLSDDPPAGRLVLVRHGQTEWSRTGRHTGRTDIPLEEAGIEAAKSLADRLAGHRFRRVLVSPLLRARETCRLAGFAGAGESCPDLLEWDYGADEGRTTAEIRRDRPGWSIWTGGVPAGETLEEVGARADRVVAEARGAGGDVLAFAHAHILRVVAARWLGLPPAGGALLVLGPATVSVLGWERETPAVLRWNDTAGDPLD
jgi:probable phosphoglycerate mutase